jgi:hypothetical protein
MSGADEVPGDDSSCYIIKITVQDWLVTVAKAHIME